MTTADISLPPRSSETHVDDAACTAADKAVGKCRAEVSPNVHDTAIKPVSPDSATDTSLPKVAIDGATKPDSTSDAVVKNAGSEVKSFVWREDYPKDSYIGDQTLSSANDFKGNNADAHDYMTMVQTGDGHYKWSFGPSGLTVDSMKAWLKVKGVDTEHLNEQTIAAIQDKDVSAVAKFASVASRLDASKGWGANAAEEKKITDTAESIMDGAPLLSAKLQEQIVTDLGRNFAAQQLKDSTVEHPKKLDEGQIGAALLLGQSPTDGDKTGNEKIMQFAQTIDAYRQQHPTGEMDPSLIASAQDDGGSKSKTGDVQTPAPEGALLPPSDGEFRGPGRHRGAGVAPGTSLEDTAILGDSMVWRLGKSHSRKVGGAEVDGVVGEQADALTARIEQMDLSHKRVAALWIGTNDLGNGVKPPVFTDDQVVQRVEGAVTAAQNAGAKHIVLASIPYRGDAYTASYGGLPVDVLNKRIDNINSQLANWAKSQSNVSFVNISAAFDPNDSSQSVDGLHMTGNALAQTRARMLEAIRSVPAS